MKKILVLGAGLSSSSMIDYLLEKSTVFDWKITVGDVSEELARKKINNHQNGRAIHFDIYNENTRKDEIKSSDIVISLLPAFMHPLAATDCIRYKKHMVTASYVSVEMGALDKEAKENGIILLNEFGLDPGIDHMSAMQLIDSIKEKGGKIIEFRSYTGGLIAPKYDTNPWNYKFTWNPRNVVMAGQGTARYLINGTYKYVPYQRVFQDTNTVNVLNYGQFEVYPNRDSLKYKSIYGLDDVKTMIRGTMRRPGYCKSWNHLINLGLTDDTFTIQNSENLTYRQFIDSFLPTGNGSVEKRFCEFAGIAENSDVMTKIKWLGLFEKQIIELSNASPAAILQHLLEKKWKLEPGDKDMIVMQHQFVYEINKEIKQKTTSLVVEGKDSINTAMAITVGIPVAIAAKLILNGKINKTGVHIPISREIYEPILKELEEFGVVFTEQIIG